MAAALEAAEVLKADHEVRLLQGRQEPAPVSLTVSTVVNALQPAQVSLEVFAWSLRQVTSVINVSKHLKLYMNRFIFSSGPLYYLLFGQTLLFLPLKDIDSIALTVK